MNQGVLHDDSFDENAMEYDNHMELEFDALSRNENFARTVVAAFVAQLNPTLEEISDIKTAVSEAVTNAIIHGYPDTAGTVYVKCKIRSNEVGIEIIDHGVGIADVERAMEPMYTTCPELERSGMGFSFMSAFMDELSVTSRVKEGTTVRMKKRIGTT